jgi:hypothetical protein
MKPSQWEIIILKPTPIFKTFIQSQLPHVELPDFRLFHTDNTAYVIPKQANDEALLDAIEANFAVMFRHEICRWLGDDARNEIEGSFLDFLCCFKFELHSQIVLMDTPMSEGRQLLRIKPRSVLLKWMRDAVENDDDLTTILNKVTVKHLAENATVVVKNFQNLSEIKPFLKLNYQSIFEAEMLRMCDNTDQWPDIDSYQTFSQYFAVEIHTQLVHL